MAMKTKISERTQTLVGLGMLSAIILLFGLVVTPLGFLTFGPVSITTLPIPVAIGAILYGTKGGTFLGFLFGITSFLLCLGRDPFGTLLFGINPFLTTLMCIVPRTAMGALCGLIYKAISKKNKNVAFVVASLSAAVLNTVLFTALLLIMFGTNATVQEFLGTNSVVGVLLAIITVNAAAEAAFTTVIGGAVSKALDVARSHM